jgi:glutamine synthetase
VRLQGGKETPDAITWGQFNRHALIRLPARASSLDGSSTTPPTIEFRLPDGSVHPYLLLAGVAQAMMLGRDTESLEELLLQTRASQEGTTCNAPGLPTSFAEVASQLESAQDTLAEGGVFPPGLLSTTITDLRG